MNLRANIEDAIWQGMIFAPQNAIPDITSKTSHSFWISKAVDAILAAVREMVPKEMEYKNFNNEAMESWNACRSQFLKGLKESTP